jgi:hypothetical protein
MRMIRRASLLLGTLALTACTTTVSLSDRMPEPATLGEGEGLAIGSIVVTTPTHVPGAEQQDMLDSLRQRKLTVTIQRYERWLSDEVGGEFGWSEDVGDAYVASFVADAEQRIVLRAPEGRYAVRELVDGHPGAFGEVPGCKIENLARFEVHAGKTTYIGRLVVSAGFKPDELVHRFQSFEQILGPSPGHIPERWLDMNLSVTDGREATLRDLALDPSRAPSAIETELMQVGAGRWAYDPPPPPEQPKFHGAK